MSNHGRGGNNNISGVANFRQANDLEEAAHAINRINARDRRERKASDQISSVEREKAKITLSPSLDTWLAKEIP